MVRVSLFIVLCVVAQIVSGATYLDSTLNVGSINPSTNVVITNTVWEIGRDCRTNSVATNENSTPFQVIETNLPRFIMLEAPLFSDVLQNYSFLRWIDRDFYILDDGARAGPYKAVTNHAVVEFTTLDLSDNMPLAVAWIYKTNHATHNVVYGANGIDYSVNADDAQVTILNGVLITAANESDVIVYYLLYGDNSCWLAMAWSTNNLTLSATAVYRNVGQAMHSLTLTTSNTVMRVPIAISVEDYYGARGGFAPCEFLYEFTNSPTVYVTAPSYWEGVGFAHWIKDGTFESVTNIATVTMSANHTLVAVYTNHTTANPTAETITPNYGMTNGGTGTLILGRNLATVTNVFFGTTPADNFYIQSDGIIGATTPAHASGTVLVRLVCPTGQATNLTFTYFVPASWLVQPHDITVAIGGTTNFTAWAPMFEDLNHTWSGPGVAFANGTNLLVFDAQLWKQGNYHCVATRTLSTDPAISETITSSNGYLTVSTPEVPVPTNGIYRLRINKL